MTISREETVALPFSNWRTVLPTVLWSGLTVIALVLISRKLSDAFVRELSVAAVSFSMTSAVLVSFAAAVLHHAGRRSDSHAKTDRSAESVLMAITALTAPLLIDLALLPSDSLAATFYAGGLFLFLLTGIVLLVTDSFSFHHKPTMILSAEFPATAMPEIAWPSIDSSGPKSDSFVDSSRIDESVSQRFTRTRTATGTERIFGSMTVCFAAGQRQVTVHLPFTPPLAVLPSVVCDVPDGNAVRLKVAAVHPYGTRIELKRTTGCETAETIEIGFTVTAEEVRTTAA